MGDRPTRFLKWTSKEIESLMEDTQEDGGRVVDKLDQLSNQLDTVLKDGTEYCEKLQARNQNLQRS